MMGKIMSPSLLKVLNIMTVLIVAVQCIPTSVLVDKKEAQLASELTSNKIVKRAPSSPSSSDFESKTGIENKIEHNADQNQQQHLQTPQKRGISQQMFPIDLSNDILVNRYPHDGNGLGGGAAGTWEDLDAGYLYPDLEEIEQQYQNQRKGAYGHSNHQKALENLQSLLNSHGGYPEMMSLPLEYQYRFNGDRRKRSNGKAAAAAKHELRKKREKQLSPSDVLTLLALAEANDRARFEDVDQNDDLPFEYYPSQAESESEWYNSLAEPSIEYFGMPLDVGSLGKYDFYKDTRHNQYKNKIPAKRFMVSKKKRSSLLGGGVGNGGISSSAGSHFGQEKFLSEPQQLSAGGNFDFGRFALPELESSQRSYRRYY